MSRVGERILTDAIQNKMGEEGFKLKLLTDNLLELDSGNGVYYQIRVSLVIPEIGYYGSVGENKVLVPENTAALAALDPEVAAVAESLLADLERAEPSCEPDCSNTDPFHAAGFTSGWFGYVPIS